MGATVEETRESIAASLCTRPSSVVFTSGGTESDNLAVKGLFWARRAAVGATTILALACSTGPVAAQSSPVWM